MKPISLDEIVDIATYERQRDQLRQDVLAAKERRRIHVGDHLTFLFENRETVRYQIQEMLRVERIVAAEAIAHEVETYNELIPGPGQLSATLLIEYTTREERDVELRRLVGLQDHVWLEVEGHAAVAAVFDTRQMEAERISSVQYLKFDLPRDTQKALLQEPVPAVAIIVDHPHYGARASLTADQVLALREDLLADD